MQEISADSKDTSKLILSKHDTPDQGRRPLVSSIKQGWSRDFSNAPTFTYADLYNYMIMKPSYDHDGLKAYKGLQGYKLYEAGHVVNLQQVVLKDFNYSFVRFQIQISLVCNINDYLMHLQGLEEKLIINADQSEADNF